VTHQSFGPVPIPDPGDAAAVLIEPRDGFADPPGLAVREDVLAAVGGPEPVRAGGPAELVARIEAAGHAVERRRTAVPPRRPTPRRLLAEGAARLWLFRRDPARFPLPRPRELGWRLPFVALGALRANAGVTRSGG
jgi:hypothetical protein